MKLINNTGGDRVIDQLHQSLVFHGTDDSKAAALLVVLAEDNGGRTP